MSFSTSADRTVTFGVRHPKTRRHFCRSRLPLPSWEKAPNQLWVFLKTQYMLTLDEPFMWRCKASLETFLLFINSPT